MRPRDFTYAAALVCITDFYYCTDGMFSMQMWELHNKCPAAFQRKHCMSKWSGGGHADYRNSVPYCAKLNRFVQTKVYG